MSEFETEDEVLDRIEAALRKIAALSQPVKPGAMSGDEREALAVTLDRLIARLREGLAVHPREGLDSGAEE
jgi:hypothetical protein